MNLVRTHSLGQYTIEELLQTSPRSDTSGQDKIEELHTPRSDTSRSCSASPVCPPMEGVEDPFVPAEPSVVLMGKTVSPPSSPLAQTGPTALEQNMAFAALQVVMSPCVSDSMLRPEKRTAGHLVDPIDVDNIRPVKRKLGA